MTTAPWWSRVGPAGRRHALVVLTVVLTALLGSFAPAWTAAAAPTPSPSATPFSSTVPLRVGSFNVRCESCYEGIGGEGTWVQRRSAVVDTIEGQDLDVLGVQEASQGRLQGIGGRNGISQYEDLLARLGSPWEMTSTVRYNCVRPFSPNRCTFRDRGASLGTRILYNSDRIALIDAGSKLLPETNTKGTRHYVTWARLQQLDTGLEFMVSNAHFTAYDENHALRKRQAQFALDEVQAQNTDQLPLIALGDWNSGRNERGGNGPRDTYVAAGLVDPLGNVAGPRALGATVEKRINTWLDSFNGWQRHAGGNPNAVNGTDLDYILTTPMRVSEWETVARLDSSGNFIGRIPSDHNLVRATLWLPTPS